MTVRKVEWKENDSWRQTKTKIGFTTNSNYTFKLRDTQYVFENFREKTEVVKLVDGKWVKVGRIDHYGTIFLGEGESYSEMNNRVNASKTPEELWSEIRSFMDKK